MTQESRPDSANPLNNYPGGCGCYLGPKHIRQYQAALFTRWKPAPNTATQRLAALRFFYVRVLKRGWSIAETPYPKKVLYLPEVLSQEEVACLIDAAEFPFHRILLMTPYATVIGYRFS